MMSANKIGSSTGCSIWLPETSPPSSYRGFLPPPFSKLQHFPRISCERDRRFAVPRCWSGGDSNCRSSLLSLYSERPCVAADFNGRVIPKKRGEKVSPTQFIGTGTREQADLERFSQEQKTQKGPAVRIPSAPATRHCEPTLAVVRVPTPGSLCVNAFDSGESQQKFGLSTSVLRRSTRTSGRGSANGSGRPGHGSEGAIECLLTATALTRSPA